MSQTIPPADFLNFFSQYLKDTSNSWLQQDPKNFSAQAQQDLEKRLSEFKAVASWLELNLSMLKATIQSMEGQKAALTSFTQFSQQFTAQTPPQDGTAEPNPSSAPPFQNLWPSWEDIGKQMAAAASSFQAQNATPTSDTLNAKSEEPPKKSTKK